MATNAVAQEQEARRAQAEAEAFAEAEGLPGPPPDEGRRVVAAREKLARLPALDPNAGQAAAQWILIRHAAALNG